MQFCEMFASTIRIDLLYKVWFIKTCTHIFTYSTILCQFFKNMYYFEEIRLVEHSKLLRQVKILQKMCQLHSYLKKNFFSHFLNFYVKLTYKKLKIFWPKMIHILYPETIIHQIALKFDQLRIFWYFKAACVCWKLVCKVQRKLNS